MSGGRLDPDWYDGWDDPVVALREGIRWGAGQTPANRDAWERWLLSRGVDHYWSSRLRPQQCGAMTTIELPYLSVLPAPTTVGPMVDPYAGPDEPTIVSSTGGRYVEVPGATVVGGWDVIEVGDGAVWPVLEDWPDSGAISNALNQRLLGTSHHHHIIRRTPQGAVEELDAAIFLCGEHSQQFGHWMIDYVPRALGLRDWRERPTTVLIDADHDEKAQWWLRLALPDCQIRVIAAGASVRVAHLVVPLPRACLLPGWRDPLVYSPELWPMDVRSLRRLDVLAREGRGQVDAVGEPYRRLWLARRPTANKTLVNSGEIEALLMRQGFEVVYCDEYAAPDLQEMFEAAAIVVAGEGAHLFNMLGLTRRPPVVVLEGPVMVTRSLSAGWLGALGFAAVFVGGESAGPPGSNPYEERQRPYRVSPADLERAIKVAMTIA